MGISRTVSLVRRGEDEEFPMVVVVGDGGGGESCGSAALVVVRLLLDSGEVLAACPLGDNFRGETTSFFRLVLPDGEDNNKDRPGDCGMEGMSTFSMASFLREPPGEDNTRLSAASVASPSTIAVAAVVAAVVAVATVVAAALEEGDIDDATSVTAGGGNSAATVVVGADNDDDDDVVVVVSGTARVFGNTASGVDLGGTSAMVGGGLMASHR
jgi:hypothetical protein